MRVLIGGVGYQYLQDMSVGPAVLPLLRELPWPAGVQVEIDDLSYGPIAIVQWLEDRPGYFQRAVLVGAVARGRAPGTVARYAWDGVLPAVEAIQERVAEAVTGVIGLENLVIVAGHFGALPPEVTIVEVEPAASGPGAEFSPEIQGRLDDVIAAVRAAAMDGCHG